MTTPSPTAGGPDSIVLIHGLWMTRLSWQPWVERFEAAGWTVHTPEWPGMDRPIEEIRSDPSPMNGVGVGEVTDAHAAFIEALPSKPIIMGHSFGGLITQLLLDRLLGAAGVGLSPAPPKGIYLLPPRALKSASVVLKNPANRKTTVPLTPEQFHDAFANTLSAADSKAVWEKLHVPAPGRPLFQAVAANMVPKSPLAFDRKRAGRAPLLIVGATADHLVPASVSTKIFHLYKHAPSTTELKVFSDRSHFLCGEPGWEEIADYSLTWAAAQASSSAA
jgi:pimeloyl-ACP methyl ester carboxylesterase